MTGEIVGKWIMSTTRTVGITMITTGIRTTLIMIAAETGTTITPTAAIVTGAETMISTGIIKEIGVTVAGETMEVVMVHPETVITDMAEAAPAEDGQAMTITTGEAATTTGTTEMKIVTGGTKPQMRFLRGLETMRLNGGGGWTK